MTQMGHAAFLRVELLTPCCAKDGKTEKWENAHMTLKAKNTLLSSLCALLALCSLWAVAGQGAPGHSRVVARIWHGAVPKARANEYEKYLAEGVKQILAIKGNLGAQMMRMDGGQNTEFEVISYWPNRKAIEAFAGKDINKTHHLPRDKEFLVKVEPTVRHYDVVFERRSR